MILNRIAQQEKRLKTNSSEFRLEVASNKEAQPSNCLERRHQHV